MNGERQAARIDIVPTGGGVGAEVRGLDLRHGGAVEGLREGLADQPAELHVGAQVPLLGKADPVVDAAHPEPPLEVPEAVAVRSAGEALA